MMRGYYGYGLSGGIGPFGVLFCILMALLFAALITLAVIYIVKMLRRGTAQRMTDGMPPHPGPVPPSLEMLNQRLAKGEISVEEYKRLREAMLFRQ